MVASLFCLSLLLINTFRLPDFKPLRGYLPVQTALFDLIGTSAYAGELLLPKELHRQYQDYSIDDLRRAYFPDNAHKSFIQSETNTKPLDQHIHSDLIATGVWFDNRGNHVDLPTIAQAERHALTKHFGSYLRHRFTFACEFLGIGKTQPNFMIHPTIDPNKFGIVFHPNALTPYMLNYVQASSSSVLAFPWFYYSLGILLGLAMLFRRYRICTASGLLVCSSFCTLLPMLLIGSTCEQRYHQWSIMAISMALMLYFNALLLAKKKTN